MPKKTTLIDRIKNAINAFHCKPIGSISYGVEVKRCSDCVCQTYHNVLEMVYRDLVNFRDNDKDVDFDDLIKYLGWVLND